LNSYFGKYLEDSKAYIYVMAAIGTLSYTHVHMSVPYLFEFFFYQIIYVIFQSQADFQCGEEATPLIRQLFVMHKGIKNGF